MRVIEGEADLDEGLAHLTAVEPRFAQALEMGARPPVRRGPAGFAPLLMIVVEQQVSVAAGRAIWARVEAGGATTPEAVLGMEEDALRGLGLSRPKARTARAIAQAVTDGAVCFHRQRTLPVDAAIAELTAVKGIGPWTAGIYQMFCEGRADLLPGGDVALQEAARRLFDLEARPSAAALEAMAEPWSPWRAVAARTLWAYYAVVKGRDGKA